MTVVSRGGAPPGERRSGPLVTTPEDRPNDQVATTATISETSVTQLGLDGLPVAFGPSYPPAGRRRLWVIVVNRCPFCRGHHLHRGTEEGPPHGAHSAGCRGRYFLVPRVPKQDER